MIFLVAAPILFPFQLPVCYAHLIYIYIYTYIIRYDVIMCSQPFIHDIRSISYLDFRRRFKLSVHIATSNLNYLGVFLGAATGSPFIVFISTSGMLRSSDIYIYIIRDTTRNRNNEFIL